MELSPSYRRAITQVRLGRYILCLAAHVPTNEGWLQEPILPLHICFSYIGLWQSTFPLPWKRVLCELSQILKQSRPCQIKTSRQSMYEWSGQSNAAAPPSQVLLEKLQRTPTGHKSAIWTFGALDETGPLYSRTEEEQVQWNHWLTDSSYLMFSQPGRTYEGETQVIKSPVKVWVTVHIVYHFMAEEDWEEMNMT